MAWRQHPRMTTTDPESPRGWGTCMRCNFIGNLIDLRWQYDWRGMQPMNLWLLVCEPCLDTMQRQLGTIILPPDPVGLINARPEQYMIDEVWPRLLEGGQPRYLENSECSRSLETNAYSTV